MIRAAVLGSPISHSLSPTLHRKAYQELGISGEYEAIEVGPGELQVFLKNSIIEWTGLSLTMPLKEEAIPLAISVSEIALQVSSANTLIAHENGWSATSTDVNGFLQALGAHAKLDFNRVLILGAGATARAVAAACSTFATTLIVVNRSPGRERLMQKAALNCEMNFIPWESQLPKVDLVVNTTPSGVADIFINRFKSPKESVFFEALYHPWPSELLRHFRNGGALGIDGLDLLIQQGIDQVSLMSKIALDDIDRKLLASILRRTCLRELER